MSRKGELWTKEEEQQLVIEYEKGVSLETIADYHGRTTIAIECRIQKLALPPNYWYLFILLLREERYYIGITKHPNNILKDNVFDRKEGKNPWLDKYPVIAKSSHILINDLFLLDKTVKHYMYRYGLSRVRGGSYSSLDLTQEQIKSIQKELSFIYQKDQCSFV